MRPTRSTWGPKLLTYENAKTPKGESLGFRTGILYLAPSVESIRFGGQDTCPFATGGCRASCLFSAGLGRFEDVRAARIAKTLLYFDNREQFLLELCESLDFLKRSAAKRGLAPAARLNGTSDISWERFGIIEQFPEIQFYDYTKIPAKMLRWAGGAFPENYHLTFSRSEGLSHQYAEQIAKECLSANIAFVYDKQLGMPAEFLGRRVIDGDLHDLRFLDPVGVCVGLTAKGRAKKDMTGFVVRIPPEE